MATLPTYYSEVAPPHSRGLMAGAHGSFINMGYAVAGWVGYALPPIPIEFVKPSLIRSNRFGCFNASSTSFGWRFPNAVLLLLALLVLAGTFFGMFISVSSENTTESKERSDKHSSRIPSLARLARPLLRRSHHPHSPPP